VVAELLRVDDLQKSFGKLAAIRSVSFAVAAGAVHGLIGPNGSGKTTLFNLISGFLRPNAGSVRFEGREISRLKPYAITRLGLVRTFQLTSIYPDFTVRENVGMGLHNRRGLDGGGRHAPGAVRAEEILALMGLSQFSMTAAGLLPAGLQRVLSIATALATGPRMLLLDEPLAGLNPSEKVDIVERIRHIRDGGVTILLVEHDIKSVLSVCDWITAINFGEKIAEGTANEIVKDDKLVQAYLGDWETAHA
jgi:branched-chain amino acid transport system ATP-binding protein